MAAGAALPALVVALLSGPAGAGARPPELRVTAQRPLTDARSLRQIALEYLGRPYVSGGVGNPGFDCSGLTSRVFAEAGYALPRVSRDQARAGRGVPLVALAPGDLVFFVRSPGSRRINHVALYLGDGEMVHASTGRGRVVVSKMSERYYAERLFSARRLLPDPGLIATSSVAPGWVPSQEVASVELVEHAGDDELPPMVRLPARLAEPSAGPDLPGFGATSLAVRAAGVTEGGAPGFVLAPEGTLRLESIAFELILALPIRFAPGEAPTVGTFEEAGDYLRFLRSLSIGLRGADLELRLTRLGDASLAGRMIVDRLQPGAVVQGIPGLAVARTPLSLFGGLRADNLELDLVIDDVAAPGVMGLGVRAPLVPGWIRGGVALATDQRARTPANQRRAISAVETSLWVDVIDLPRWSLGVAGLGGLERRAGALGFGAAVALDAEYRFARGGTSAVGVRGDVAYLGAGFLDGLFGATYAPGRSAHFDALATDETRAAAGGEIRLRWNKLLLAAGHRAPLGAGAHSLDSRTFVLVELHDLALLDTHALDLRLSYAARGLFSRGDEAHLDVLHGTLRLRLASWLYAEAYLAEAESFEGGGGLSAAWIP
ncbi:MAG: C40 family peptidase [Deltaproteobacteria bacterium]|nr:C40 family peptidase [Deltaproteobacteria bacterium]